MKTIGSILSIGALIAISVKVGVVQFNFSGGPSISGNDRVVLNNGVYVERQIVVGWAGSTSAMPDERTAATALLENGGFESGVDGWAPGGTRGCSFNGG
jgi:hypothetical protein